MQHRGPSLIDRRTLARSSDLPDTFLRRCGYLNEEISFQRSQGAVQPYHSCFICYCSDDDVFARRLYDVLQHRGIRCYLDEESGKVGEEIFEMVHQAILQHDRVLLCCSEAALKSTWGWP